MFISVTVQSELNGLDMSKPRAASYYFKYHTYNALHNSKVGGY